MYSQFRLSMPADPLLTVFVSIDDQVKDALSEGEFREFGLVENGRVVQVSVGEQSDFRSGLRQQLSYVSHVAFDGDMVVL